MSVRHAAMRVVSQGTKPFADSGRKDTPEGSPPCPPFPNSHEVRRTRARTKGASLLHLGIALPALLLAPVAQADEAAPDADQGKVARADASANASASDIIVTASPFAHSREDTPAIVVSVDSDSIRNSGGASIAGALANMPGIAATGFASGASRPIIRGMDATRVRILEDGTSSSDVSDIGPDHGLPVDPLAARSIEVVRGAGTLRYGSQAIGGVINILNNRVPTSLPAKAFSGEVSGSHDTVADIWQGSALADVALGNVVLHADGFARDAQDYATPIGRQTNSFFRGHGGSLGGSYFLGGGESHIGAAVTRYDAKYGIPADQPYIDVHQTKVITRNGFALGDGVLKMLDVDGSYADYQHSEVEPDGTINSTFKNKEGNVRAELLLNRIGFVRNSALGVEYQHRRFSALGEGASYLLPASQESIAAYVFTELELARKLHLEASARVERVRVNGTPASDIPARVRKTPVSGALGMLYQPVAAVKLGLTFSSTARAPALTELFARGAHDGPATFETGDPSLRSERANALEASLRIRAGRFSFDGSIYSSWFHHYIYGDLSGQLCDEDGLCAIGGPGGLRELSYRQQGAHFRGIEGEAHFTVAKTQAGNFTLKALGDVTRATLHDGSNVPRIPPWRLGGGVELETDRLDAGMTLLYAGRQDKVGAIDTSTPGYVSLNAQIAWRPFRAQPGIEFAVIGQNLTDDLQRNAAALNKDVVAMPGRNVRFVVKLGI